MQTFLPYPSYIQSAQCLDSKRLGKQRVECLQILKAITDPTYGWQNHPAVKMWRNWQASLVLYGQVICREWRNRGFNDTCLEKILIFNSGSNQSIIDPDWLTPDLCASHRSNLLRKDPVHYGQFGWTERNDLPYIWPV